MTPSDHSTPDAYDIIAEWMIALLEEDRPAAPTVYGNFSSGLLWLYEASLIRPN